MRRLLFLAFLLSLPARAAVPDVGDCDDDFSECRETCTMQFGTKTDVSKKKRFGKCLVKCGNKQNDCRERALETKRNNLDEGSLAKSTSTRQSDEDDLRHADDAPAKPAPADDDEKPRAKKQKASDDEPKAEAVRDDEVVKSSRTKVSDPPPPKKDEPKPAAARAEEPAPKHDPAARREEPPRHEEAAKREAPPPRAEEKPKQSGLDSDIRAEDEKPAKREDSKPKDEGKKKKERALDEWDPDAL